MESTPDISRTPATADTVSTRIPSTNSCNVPALSKPISIVYAVPATGLQGTIALAFVAPEYTLHSSKPDATCLTNIELFTEDDES